MADNLAHNDFYVETQYDTFDSDISPDPFIDQIFIDTSERVSYNYTTYNWYLVKDTASLQEAPMSRPGINASSPWFVMAEKQV